MKKPSFFDARFILPLAAVALGSGNAAVHAQEKLFLREEVGALLLRVTSPRLTPERCEEGFASIARQIRGLRPELFDRSEVVLHGKSILEKTFKTRLALRADLKRLHESGVYTEKCSLQARSLMRHLRGVEDFIGSIASQKQSFDFGGEKTKFLPKSALLNPSVQAPAIRSGDVLLSRGNAVTSALIARMSDEDTQFSHMALVYIDPKTGKAWTIEAHIEFGSMVIPLENWLADGKSRTMLFRQSDAARAHRAAALMFKKVSVPYWKGTPIEYDFPFDMDDPSKLFCSEVVRVGYGEMSVPLYPSRFTMKNRDLMDRLGIHETRSFLPADLEVDPRFDVVAEWRDFRKVPTLWKNDAIITKFYAWMELGYRFDSLIGQNLKARLAKGLRWFGALKEKMPSYMTRDVVETNLMLEALASDLSGRLEGFEAAHRARTGYPPDYVAYGEELERIRLEAEASGVGLPEYFHR
jgi:hypothetical protein